jgi:excinuclease ABC subunit C
VENRAAEPIREKLDTLPQAPGVYLMLDGDRRVLYVGKAASLRSRVRSYFHAESGQDAKTARLVGEIRDIEVIETNTEAGALLLEDALIKRHQPPFNIRLRDDKRYPYLKLTAEPFPRILIVRRREEDGAQYFGPFTNVKAMRATLKLAQRLFPIRTCALDLPLETPRRPCLNYHIGRCHGPCSGEVTEKEYAEAVRGAAMLFDGRIKGLVSRLKGEMETAAEAQRFERAAAVRDQIRALQHVLERQSMSLSDGKDRDVIGAAVSEGQGGAQVFRVREGRVIGREAFFLETPAESSAGDVIEAFLPQYYARSTTIPREVLLSDAISDPHGVEEALAALRGRRVRLHVPQRGEKRHLAQLAADNARHALARQRVTEAMQEDALAALTELASSLSLASFPQRIEAFDISNTQGGEATGSMVVFENGRPRRDSYRRFKVHISGKPDDYAMMSEVLQRRFRRGLAELSDPTVARGKFSELPDLLVIDGGKGQLAVAVDVLRELEIDGIEAIGLAKRKEEIYRPGEPSPRRLPDDSAALLLLRRIRDEAHRFAVTYHRRLRAKRSMASLLDEIRGIGPRRKSALMRRFGSVERLAHASAQEIAAVGIPEPLARTILERLDDSG